MQLSWIVHDTNSYDQVHSCTGNDNYITTASSLTVIQNCKMHYNFRNLLMGTNRSYEIWRIGIMLFSSSQSLSFLTTDFLCSLASLAWPLKPWCNISRPSFMDWKKGPKPNCCFPSPSVSFINNHMVSLKTNKQTKSCLCLSFLTSNLKLLMVLNFDWKSINPFLWHPRPVTTWRSTKTHVNSAYIYLKHSPGLAFLLYPYLSAKILLELSGTFSYSMRPLSTNTVLDCPLCLLVSSV